MWLLTLALLYLLVLCGGQQCPSWGEVKRTDPYNQCRYLYCYNGRGRWCYCPQGRIFSEQQQGCVFQASSKQKSYSNGSSRRPSTNTGSSTAVWDYHW